MRINALVTETRKWARLHGGAAIWIGSDDGDQSEPIIDGGNIRFLQNFERDELTPCRYYEDPFRPKFGEPSHYRISPMGRVSVGSNNLVVHESRLILFYGVLTTKFKRIYNNSFGSSVLLRCIKAVSQFYGAFASALAAMADANQNVLKTKDLNKMIRAGHTDLIREKIKVMDEFRSALKTLAVDADGEDFIRSSLALTGVEGILDKVMLRLAAAAKMPVTRLMGQAPAGLNATGESDERAFQAQAQFEQSDILGPALTRIMRFAFRSPSGPTNGKEPDSWSIKWPSLWEPTQKEEADIDGTHAQVDTLMLTAGVYRASDIAKARYRGERTRVILSDERIRELEFVETGIVKPLDGEMVATPGAMNAVAPMDELPSFGSGEIEPGAAEGASDVDTTDEVDNGPSAAVVQFAADMNLHQYERCRHSMPNKCKLCGVERIPVAGPPNPDGTPNFPLMWVPIQKPKAEPVNASTVVTATPGAADLIAPAVAG
jgi:phage-related protein (TIGR01555 family)